MKCLATETKAQQKMAATLAKATLAKRDVAFPHITCELEAEPNASLAAIMVRAQRWPLSLPNKKTYRGSVEVAPSMVRPALTPQAEAATAEQQAIRLRLQRGPARFS